MRMKSGIIGQQKTGYIDLRRIDIRGPSSSRVCDGVWTMHLFSTFSYLVRALIFLCLIHWSSTHTRELNNLRDQNGTSSISTDYQHGLSDNSSGRFSSNATSTKTGLDVVQKRQKRCLLTMMALESVAGFTDWFSHIVHEEPEVPTSPQRRKPMKQRITTSDKTTTGGPSPSGLQNGSQSCVTKWGFCISGGKPDYNLMDAPYIMDVEIKLVMNVWIIQFRHPMTKEIIQVPRDVPDEYVVFETRQVFIIFVDRRGRTFLIFKRRLRPDELEGSRTDKVTKWFVTNPNTNVMIILNHLIFLSNANDKNVGRLVMQNVPKYDPSTAVFIMDVKKKVMNGIWVVEFRHPTSNVLVQVPIDMGDDYVVATTHQIFKVFVDFTGKTFMIYVGLDNPRTNANKPGVLSINNVPPYDIEKAIRIHDVVQTVVEGMLMIEFMHPDTKEITQVPFNVGDVHIEPLTKKVFLIFIDNEGRTLLIFKGMVREDIDFFRDTLGSVVTKNKPRYNIKNATIINDTRQKCGLDGKPLLEWVHPLTLRIIQISVDIGQVYVDAQTKKVYVIFVDTEGRTFLILKGVDGADRLFPDDNNIVGRLVVEGIPKYDLVKAILVMDTELKVLADGSIVVVFEHPITKQRAQIPPNIGDEHVDKPRQRIFIIFVDTEGRTLLVFKGWRQNDDRQNDIDPLQIGYLVDNGTPRWNLQTAIIIRKTELKIAPDGSILIEFEHPIIKRNIQIPRDKGDDYEMKKTGEVFKIFVGYFQRTFLIFKGPDDREKDNDSRWEIGGVKIVVRGVPKYNMTRPILIENTEQILDKYGRIVIVFDHPTGKQKILLPYNKGDVYVNTKTKRVYKICVDSEGNTLMVYTRNERDRKEQWITVVKRGFPAYDLAKAIFVMDTEIKMKRRGIFVSEFVEFTHPFSHLMFRISSTGADRYVKPETQQVFIICIDNRGRTLLIFEGMQPGLLWQKDPDIKWVEVYSHNVTKTSMTGLGSIVVDGYPPYDISQALYVLKVMTKRGSDGVWTIVFKHPKTREVIRVPMYGGDEHVDDKTGKVFIIYVDSRKETLLILKPDVDRYRNISGNQRDVSRESQEYHSPNDGSSDENLNKNINVNINKNLNNGSDDL